MELTTVLVTRGDLDLSDVLDSLPDEWPIVIWNNAEREDLKVYGHFAALAEVETEYVIMQDDDAICPLRDLAAAWRPEHADKILTNVADGDTPWISWGAIFHRDLPAKAIGRYLAQYPMDDDVLLWCDMIFSTLTPWVNVDLSTMVRHLPQAYAANRMWQQPGHYTEQARVRDKCLALLESAAE